MFNLQQKIAVGLILTIFIIVSYYQGLLVGMGAAFICILIEFAYLSSNPSPKGGGPAYAAATQ